MEKDQSVNQSVTTRDTELTLPTSKKKMLVHLCCVYTAFNNFLKASKQFMAAPNSCVSHFDASLPGTLPVSLLI